MTYEYNLLSNKLIAFDPIPNHDILTKALWLKERFFFIENDFYIENTEC